MNNVEAKIGLHLIYTKMQIVPTCLKIIELQVKTLLNIEFVEFRVESHSYSQIKLIQAVLFSMVENEYTHHIFYIQICPRLHQR